MGRIFQPARIPVGASAPETHTIPYTAGQAFIKGAVLIYDSAGNQGNVIEGGADPALIVGVALEAPASKPGFSVNFDSTVVARTGAVTSVSVAMANRVTIFSGRGVNGGTDPVIPLQTHVGTTVSLLKTGAGEWVLDFADGANQRVRVVAIDVTLSAFFFRFLEANLATP
jgi:hypothetical protein